MLGFILLSFEYSYVSDRIDYWLEIYVIGDDAALSMVDDGDEDVDHVVVQAADGTELNQV